jgi:NDP-sugar pyrophosphorylase family protein
MANTWLVIKTWQQSPANFVAGGTRYAAATGEWVEIGAGARIGAWASIGAGARIGAWASIGAGARIGAWASIGAWARIGAGARIGAWASIGAGANHPTSPLYLWPQSGPWPIYVSDVDKRLVGIGCEVHPIEWWLAGGADKVREKHNAQITASIYDPALLAVAKLMGWDEAKEPVQ